MRLSACTDRRPSFHSNVMVSTSSLGAFLRKWAVSCDRIWLLGGSLSFHDP